MNKIRRSLAVKTLLTTITAILLTAIILTTGGCNLGSFHIPEATEVVIKIATDAPATEAEMPFGTELPATDEPTLEPTELPATDESTFEPTELPASAGSTLEPTEVPATDEPTLAPTEVPATDEPTLAPTEVPATAEPTPEQCSHEYTEATIDPTCTEKGRVTYTCKKCGDTYYEELAKLGHAYGEWKVTKEASCQAAGEKTRTCSRCGKTETQSISGGDHHWDNGVQFHNENNCADEMLYTCTVCGSQYSQVLGYSHSIADRSSIYARKMWCENCHLLFMDYYAQFEDLFSSQDPNAALYTDTVHFERLPYTVRTGWSKRWKQFERDVIASAGHYRNTQGDEYYYGGVTIGPGETEQDVLNDYNEFRKAFSQLYGWTPTDAVIEDNEFEVFFITNSKKMHKAFESGASKMSDAQKEALTETLLMELIYNSGIYEGMQLYDAVGLLYDTIKERVKYDWYLGYHSAFYGLCGGSCVCDGFAEIFQRCCDYIGINCKTIVGTCRGEGHAWNMVTFSDGTERFIDVTLDTGDYRILFTKSFYGEYKY